MMYGMFGFGWLMMLLVMVVPVLLIILMIGWATGGFQNLGKNLSSATNPIPEHYSATKEALPLQKAERYCSHCGTGLQSDWSHCPQCGAPVG
ncbi:MAG: hypothetical protein C3F13_04245 [Anaerolineales bacterium]|nr:MAG: hypothetical protein C3F13_04245 [Anaerolineales bacterium]